jgi:hypothetical protein
MFIFVCFVIWRIVDFIVAFIARTAGAPYTRFDYIYHIDKNSSFIPKFFISFANFDGAHYLGIAQKGYQPLTQSFFPLYPLVIRLLNPLFGSSYFLTGMVVSNICFLLGLYYFKKYLELSGKSSSEVLWTLLFLICFPTSFFFGAVYTEGIFFFLVAATLYFAKKKNFTKILITAILSSLTRLIGVVLIIPLFFMLSVEWKYLQKIHPVNAGIFWKYIKTHKKIIGICLSPLLGLFVYMGFLWLTTGDALAFYHFQSAFNNGRTANHLVLLPQVYYRYIRIFITAHPDITYFIAAVEFTTYTVFLIVLLYDLWKLWKERGRSGTMNFIGLNLFSFINLLLPSLTGTLTSTPRYLLVSLSFFIRIAQVKNNFFRYITLFIFIILHIILLSLFIQDYFVS